MIDKQIESICKNNGNMIAVDEIEGTEYLKGELIELDADGNGKKEVSKTKMLRCRYST